jgi:hypothetical protein
MDKFESLSHTAWECKYHVVFIPKCRRRTPRAIGAVNPSYETANRKRRGAMRRSILFCAEAEVHLLCSWFFGKPGRASYVNLFKHFLPNIHNRMVDRFWICKKTKIAAK